MAELAADLLRTIARAFYHTEHILLIDALILHSTLPEKDLCDLLNFNTRTLRTVCGRLREDGLLSTQQRAERRIDGSQAYFVAGQGQHGKERVNLRDWYYLNYHRAIDSIKYRLYKLSKHVEGLAAPSTEKKDLVCPWCKGQWAELDALEYIDHKTGIWQCPRCGHALDHVEDEERMSENESMKRLNSQLEKILSLMQRIDATTVPENDFQTALSNHRPVNKSAAHQGPARTEAFDLPNGNVQSTKGLDLKPEKIAVQIQDDESLKRDGQAADAQARRDREAKQNALPEWIAASTITGDKTVVGAREEQARLERSVTAAVAKEEGDEDKKPVKDADKAIMAAYWEALERQNAEDAARAKESDEEEEEDEEDDFEDVVVGGLQANGAPISGNHANGSTIIGTSGLESSNATDDEPDPKRIRVVVPLGPHSTKLNTGDAVPATNASASGIAEGTPAASDEDEDDMEFEDV